MTDLNSIFKSDLTDNEKKAKTLFAKLIIALKKNNCMRLYSLLTSVSNTKYNDNVITLVFSDKSSYEMCNNISDKEIINNELNKLEAGLKCEFECDAKVEFNAYQFKEFLKSEFGKILTIK